MKRGLTGTYVVREITGKRRNRVFAYSWYMAILNEDEPRVG